MLCRPFRAFSPSTRQQVKLSPGFLMQIDKLRIHLRHVLGFCLSIYLVEVLAWPLNANYTKAWRAQGSDLGNNKFPLIRPTVSDHMWVKFMWSAWGIHRHKSGQSGARKDERTKETTKGQALARNSSTQNETWPPSLRGQYKNQPNLNEARAAQGILKGVGRGVWPLNGQISIKGDKSATSLACPRKGPSCGALSRCWATL